MGKRDSEDSVDGPDLEKHELGSQAEDAVDAAPVDKKRASVPRRISRSVKGLFVPLNPPPPKASVHDAEEIPEVTAGWFSLLTFSWLNPLMTLGYARPLEDSDLYKLQDHRSSTFIADKILTSFEARRKAADEYNVRLANGEIKPSLRQRVAWSVKGNRAEREKHWREEKGKRKPSLTWAMNDSIKWWFWSGGVLKVTGDTAQVTSPLLVKHLLNFATESYVAHRTGQTAPPIGRGIGYAIGLFLLQMIASFSTHHFFYRSSSSGVLIRGGLITAIYTRSLRLTTRARAQLSTGKLVNHISTDVSRIDFCCGFFHMFWAAPIQLVICLILLIINLGPSALAGFAIFVVLTPIQGRVMKSLFQLRKKAMVWTDKRAKLLQELLGGMKVIKFFAWEQPFLKRISGFRTKEMGYVRNLLLFRAGITALAMSTPTLASVLAFVVYAVSGHDLTPGVIFSSLSLFQLLRMPLMFIPMSVASIADARNAIGRLENVFMAELVTETLVIDPTIEPAIEVKDACFTWDAPPPEPETKKKKVYGDKGKAVDAAAAKDAPKDKKDEDIFHMKDINMSVPKGKLVAIVGAVGAGKTSLLQGLLGDMRRTSGTVRFSDSVAYCSQSAWIQNATVRENVCFGRPFEPERYWKAVADACLEADLDVLPNGDLTEVGEKGISLSGGQKQRVNICRAIYSGTKIQIFDDPLSALDAHVGQAVFKNVLADNSRGSTRLLVTHALHFLPEVDYIYSLADGRIAEQGTFAEIMAAGGEFARNFDEFVSKDKKEEKKEEEGEVEEEEDDAKAAETKKRKAAVRGAQLMQVEERSTGAVNANVYKAYLRSGNGPIMLPLMLFSLVLMQVATVLSSYWLVWWQERKFGHPQGFYMGIYAFLGVAQALLGLVTGSVMSVMVYTASRNLHKDAIRRVMHAPMSFFETTPIGRIMNRFSKDVDTIDNLLADAIRTFLNTFSGVIGAVILIAILQPWFLIAVAVVTVMYAMAAAFYRASARELKVRRLDAILRSSLYSHFSESLSGLATIRAYGEEERFYKDNRDRVDIENRAYWLTVTNQRWLGIRLDFLGSILTLVVAMLTVGTRFSISPAKSGVTLSYILSIQQAFGFMVRQLAEVENDMNSVERIVYYAQHVEQEAPHEIPDHKPTPPWPGEGKVEIKDVVLKYRPELPAVLKGLTMSVTGGEKIGIVGRTGAGKSSIMTALFRIVELVSGSITIDGVDISKIGLADVRKGLAIIPQDATLFSGTLRSNLDPFDLHDDARLWDALKRSYLVEDAKPAAVVEEGAEEDKLPTGASTPMGPRFSLDSPIEEEGNNLSIGQRSLVSLARALVKDSKVLILDEATASVDYETDRKIQETIKNEFRERTILCIAHRLRTIIAYDRICVMDQGTIAEFDTPANLYLDNGIFRTMCERSGITLEDIKRAAKERTMEGEEIEES
ncbi:ABC transporter [Auriscalpium vulgare]|uniref:ABC transporter n=1 Tax=Auriscalpium vulgare TaxID=40419 RepID=A0ACB8RBI5_9AGAM|nr:ABC transporter [Auriscalpium vulgare]